MRSCSFPDDNEAVCSQPAPTYSSNLGPVCEYHYNRLKNYARTHGFNPADTLSSFPLGPQQLAHTLERCIKEQPAILTNHNYPKLRVHGYLDLAELAKRVLECMEGAK